MNSNLLKTAILEDIGLTSAEIKIYIALLQLGSASAGPLMCAAKLYNSVTHTALQSLVGKGFVSYIQKGHTRHYHAKDPKYILEFMDKRRKRAEELLPLLQAQAEPSIQPSAEIFQGFPGFKIMNYQLIDNAKPGDEWLFFSFHPKDSDRYEEVFDFYKEFEKERHRRGIVVKGIAPAAIKGKFTGRNLKNILFVDFPTLNNINVVNDCITLHPFEENETAFLIRSRDIATSFRDHFYSIWNRYKKD